MLSNVYLLLDIIVISQGHFYKQYPGLFPVLIAKFLQFDALFANYLQTKKGVKFALYVGLLIICIYIAFINLLPLSNVTHYVR